MQIDVYEFKYITFYDFQKHTGLNELFDDFGNELWRRIIVGNDNKKPVFLVEHQRKVYGFTGLLDVQSNKRGYFSGIGVHSDYRSHGVGTVLFSVLCQELKKLGAEYMTLFIGEDKPARYIYESAGFIRVKLWQTMRKEIR